MKKRSHRLIKLLIVVVIVGAGWVLLDWGHKGPPTLSRETTVVEDEKYTLNTGYVDYYQVFNDQRFAKIDPRNNGAVWLLAAVGPDPSFDFDKYWQLVAGDSLPRPEDPFLIGFQEFTETDLDPSTDPVELLDRALEKTWTADEFPHVQNWLEANAKPLEHALQAARADQFCLPLYNEDPKADLLTALLPYSQVCRHLAQLMVAKALHQLGQGQIDAGQDLLLDARRLGQHVGLNGTLVEYLVGVSIEYLVWEAEQVMLKQPALTSASIQRYLDGLDAIPEPQGIAGLIDTGSRLMGLSAAQSLHRGEVTNPLQAETPFRIPGLDIDVLMKRLNQEYDQLVEIMEIDDHVQRHQALEEWAVDMKARADAIPSSRWLLALFTRSGRSEMASEILVSMLMPALGKIDDAHLTWLVQRRMIRIACELERKFLDQGQYPASLDPLADALADRDAHWNRDPFSGELLTYRQREYGYQLYSVGRNRADNQGTTSEFYPEEDDIVIERQRNPAEEPPAPD